MSQFFRDFTKICILILLFFTTFCVTAREVTLRHIAYRWSQEYFSNFTTHLQNNSVDMNINTIKHLVAGLKGHTEFQIRLNGSKVYQTLFSYTLDFCNMVMSDRNTIYKKWLSSFPKYGNFMQNCPVLSGRYYLKGWKLDPDLIPSYLFAGDYRIRGQGFYNKLKSKEEKFVVTVELEITVT